MLQPFSMGLSFKAKEMWGVQFDTETDVGDIKLSIDIIDLWLKVNPQGRVFIYQDWPNMKPGKVPPDHQLPRWAVTMKATRGKIRTAESPDRNAFDYEKVWSLAKHKPTIDPKRFWLHENARSRDYDRKLFEAFKKHFPELWKQGRLTAIPVGDIFMALHRKAKAGELPGVASIDCRFVSQRDAEVSDAA